MVKITGSALDLSYRRTTPYPMDATSVFETIEDARVYARNNDTETYVPYAGQIISVLENGSTYKLVKDETVSEKADGKKHYKLDKIGGNNDNDDRYVRKDIEETIEKLMTFLEGINVRGVAAIEQITLLNDIVSKNFSNGSTGFGIYRDDNGNYHLDIDFVDIRRRLTVNEIQVQQSSYIGGKQWNTAAGLICNGVEDMGGYWRCRFKTTDSEGRTVRNTFEPGDQAICETFNLMAQAGGTLGNHYYWRLIVGKGDDYIDLSKSDGATGSDAPHVGDAIVQLGNRTDTSRQGAICWDSVTAGGPYVRVYKGIDSYHLPEPNIDLNPEESVIKAKLVSEASGKDIEDAFSSINDNIDKIVNDMDSVKDQTDKMFVIWFEEYTPTLSNLPASDWTDDATKAMHEQDLFFNTSKDVLSGGGRAFRFEKGSNGVYAWIEVTDKDTIAALEAASKAQDTADGKRRVFISQPKDSEVYDIGDMWVNVTFSEGSIRYENDMLVCKTAKKANEPFSILHWKPASTATTAYLENLGDRILAAVTDSEEGIEAAKRLANKGIEDAYAAAQSAVEALGIAMKADGTATENTTVIQVMKDSIAALVEGVHFDEDGKITNVNTSGMVTLDYFNTLFSKNVKFDENGHIVDTTTSGLVTMPDFAQLFSEKASAEGYVKRADISTFITEDDAGRLISNARIEADNINFIGKTIINDKFEVDEDGNVTMNDMTANNAVISGTITAKDGKIGGFKVNGYNLSNFDNQDCWISIEYTKDGCKRISSLGNNIPGTAGYETAGYFSSIGTGENYALTLNASGSSRNTFDGGKENYAIKATGGCDWKTNQGDYWCMPGLLGVLKFTCSFSNNTFHWGIQRVWGNGIPFVGGSFNGMDSDSRVLNVNMNMGHDRYFVIGTAFRDSQDSNRIWEMNTMIENTDSSGFNVSWWYNNSKKIPVISHLFVFGDPA